MIGGGLARMDGFSVGGCVNAVWPAPPHAKKRRETGAIAKQALTSYIPKQPILSGKTKLVGLFFKENGSNEQYILEPQYMRFPKKSA